MSVQVKVWFYRSFAKAWNVKSLAPFDYSVFEIHIKVTRMWSASISAILLTCIVLYPIFLKQSSMGNSVLIIRVLRFYNEQIDDKIVRTQWN